jgi:hypothetical protein
METGPPAHAGPSCPHPHILDKQQESIYLLKISASKRSALETAQNIKAFSVNLTPCASRNV